MKILKFTSFVTLLTLIIPISLFGNLDFLAGLYYDPSKTYSEGEEAILENDPGEIYTAKQNVPVNTPPPNFVYWAGSEEHTTNLTSENSEDLANIPSDNFDQTTPGSAPTDEEPSFSLSLLEITIDENEATEVTTVFASNAVDYNLSKEKDYKLFDLDDTTFQLSFKESPDYEDPVDLDEDNIYEVVVVATNNNGTAYQTVQITVQNIIEAPVFTPSSTDVVEFSSETGEYSVNVSDTNTADITLTGTADTAFFFYNTATGIISFDPNFDPEPDASYSLVIEATNAEGSSYLTLTVNTNFDEESDFVPSGHPNASNEAFVMQQYLDFLEREADEDGLAAWLGIIENGLDSNGDGTNEPFTRADLVNIKVSSEEFDGKIAPVTRLYFAYYGRLPDQVGFEGWINYKIGKGPGEWDGVEMTIEEMSQYFVLAPEFVDMYGNLSDSEFVALVYQNVLGRTGSTDEIATWVDVIQNGFNGEEWTRGRVMVGFSESIEYKSKMDPEVRVVSLYWGLLNRVPDAIGWDGGDGDGGAKGWPDYIKEGWSPNLLINGFLDSEEYKNRFNATSPYAEK